MLFECIRSLIAARDHDERQIGQRDHAINRGCRLFEHCEMIRHRPKAFRLTPERLHDGMQIGWELPHLADQSLQGTRGGWPEDANEPARNALCAARQQGETGPHDTDSRQELADARQLNATAQQTRLLSGHRMPFTRRIEQHQAGDVIRVCRCVGARQKRAKGMADQHRRSIVRRIGENSAQLGQHPGDRARSFCWIAPAQASAIVGARTREGRDVRAYACPAQGRGCDTGLEEDRRPASTGTDQMQMLSADVDHRAGRGIEPCAASSTNELVHGTCREAYDEHASDRDDDHLV